MILTLKELCTQYNISRRAIQGYEKAGLLTSKKNSRGYLVYDIDAIQRIKRIRDMQKFGFTIKEIKGFLDAPNNILREELIRKAEILSKKEKELTQTIQEIQQLIDSL